MPLHGKIVVIKRSGGDGTEFPLTTSCLFGRKAECDIRIQLPNVSKEHCRIDLNENKEVILTNLSSVNLTRVNGKALQQSERLKHGDLITILDRSFRFEYPPAPTPRKRTSGAKAESIKVLRDQQVSDAVVAENGEKRTSEVSKDPHLKDGANIDNIQRSLEKTSAVESMEDGSQLQNKANSPFGDLYEIIKKSLDVKTPRKSSVSQVQTPSSRFGSPKPRVKPAFFTPKNDGAELLPDPKGKSSEMPQSVRKQGKTSQVPPADEPSVEGGESAIKSETTSVQRRSGVTPQKFTVSEVLEQIAPQTFKSPTRRRSKENTPAKSVASTEQEERANKSPKTENPRRTSPRNSGAAEKVGEEPKKRKSGELRSDSPAPMMKRKRVSFGGHLSPELFDKRLPPDSPLRKGATPRRSLSLCKPKRSLLRRASVIGLLKKKSPAKTKTPSPKSTSASPRTPTGRKSPKSGSPSPKRTSLAKKSPQSESSPKSTSPGRKSPKPASPAQKSPKSKSSPKAASPVQKSPRSRSSSPKAASPAKTSPKSKSSSPVREKSPAATKMETPMMREQRKSTTPGQQRRSSLGKSTPTSVKNASLNGTTAAKTPSDSGVQTPTVQGRFSVSRISTPSPTAEVATQQEPSITATPKIQLKRKSMKSTSRKTPSISRSAVTILQRRSGISRASMKVLNSWADIVKFGQTKTQVVAPAKQKVTQKATKKGVPKPQTPARKLEDHVSTGHADSPVTIVVGRAHKRTVAHLTGVAPRVVTNTALFKKDMKMDEDLTGISDMFKTPAHERKRRSLMIESSATKTPAAAFVAEPSVLNTPEEPGEMMVSPLSVASTAERQRYNSEAVQRLLDGDQESTFVSDAPASEVQSKSDEQQGAAPKMTSVTTPKQKPESPECLTGVKRIMKTPKQKAEPIEDLRGKILKTPRLKAEQQECLTGVKRIMKTPKQKAEPVEDIRGKLLITPKQKPEQQECLTGVKRIFKTPKQKAEPLEDLRGKLLKTPKALESGEVSLDGVKELLETPKPEPQSDHQSERTGVKTPDIKSSPTVRLTDVKKVLQTPKEEYAPVEDNLGVKKLMRTPKEQEEPIKESVGIKRSMKSQRLRGVAPVEDFEGLQELMQEPPTYLTEIKAHEVVTVPQEASDVPQQQPEADMEDKNSVEVEMPALDPSVEKKPVRGRRAKTVKSIKAEGKKEAPELSENPIITPVRGRTWKKPEAVAPPAARHTTRGRRTEMTENKENAPQPSKVVPKLKRGRKAPEDPSEMVQDVVITEEGTPDPEREQRPAVGVEYKVNENAAPVKKTELRPKRVRKAKQSAAQQQNEPCLQTEDVLQAEEPKDVSKTCSEQPEVLPDVMETVIQAPETENPPDVEAAACEVTETIKTSVQKKPVRGRRAKLTESKEAESKQEAAESPDRPVSAPVRGKRAKKTQAAAPPAVKQTTRNRNAKSQESTAVETQVIIEVSAEAVSAQTSLNTTQEKMDSTLPTEAVTPKPTRGRKAKLTPVEPEIKEVLSSKSVHIAQPPLSVPSAGRPTRGRKAKSDVEEQSNVTENTDIPEEVKPQPPARAKRGRCAQQKEDVKTAAHEILNNQKPVKNSRRARKAEQDNTEPTEEVQAITMGVPDKTEAPPTDPERSEQAAVAAKPRRGGRKAKPDTAVPVESTEVLNSSTDKPKGGRRGKQVTQDVVTVESSERELEEQRNVVSTPQNIKAGRGKGKNEVPQVITAKRARRGAAASVEETTKEPAVQASEPAPVPIEPARKGRRATAKATGAKEVQASNGPAKATEDLSEDVMDIPKTKKSVKFQSDLQILEIPKATPVKVVRGKRSKPADIKNENASKETNKPEEEGLSEKVVEAQPVKRGRRGVKAAGVTAKSTSEEKDAEAEPQPKTRRGRSAKK